LDHSLNPHTKKLVTPRHKVNYWVNPNDYTELSRRQRTDLEQKVEVKFVSELGYRCQVEQQQQERLMQEAQGWFSVDERILEQARNLPMKNCKRYQEIRGSRY
jgi:DnaJ family protein B protein 12